MKIIHKVSTGDSIEKIAEQYKVNPNELIKINELQGYSLQGVHHLIIPKHDSDFVVIKNLDKEFLFEVKTDNKQALNHLLKEKYVVASTINNNVEFEEGDKIIFKNSNHKSYVVKPLDTLQNIAKKFGVTEERLMEVNSLKSSRVFIGQKLIV